MANLINQISRANNFLLEHKFKIIGDVNDELKCGICQNILNVAYQTDCGCHFCKKCIDDYKNNGENCCPGNTRHCQYSNLSDIVIDHRVNRQILELIVRCDNEKCDFDCELMNMEMHMETCPKKTVNCLFEMVGCEDKVIGDKINDHLQLNNYCHSKLLLETINNLRNEVKELKENEKTNKNEISMLKIKMDEQKEEIKMMENKMIEMINCKEKKIFESINENVKTIKIVDKMKTEIREQIDAVKTRIEEMRKINERNKKELDEKKTRNCERMDSIDKEMESNKNKMENVENEMTKKIYRDIKSMKMEMEIKMNEEKKKGEQETRSRMNRLEKYLNTRDGIFVWNIGRIDKLEFNQEYFSEYFYNRINPYKMGLELWRYKEDGRLGIWFLIYCGASDDDLHWPFKATVTIKIARIYDQNLNKTITENCTINRPINNESEWSEGFLFEKFDLLKIGLDRSCIIECFIDYNK